MCEKCENKNKFLYQIQNCKDLKKEKDLTIHDYVLSLVPCSCKRNKKQKEIVYDIPQYLDNQTFDYDSCSIEQEYVYVSLQNTQEKGFIISGAPNFGKANLLVSYLSNQYKQYNKSICIKSERDILYTIKNFSNFRKQDLSYVFTKIDCLGILHIGEVRNQWDRDILIEFYISLYEESRIFLCGTSYYNESKEKSLEKVVSIGTQVDFGVYSKLRNLCPILYKIE